MSLTLHVDGPRWRTELRRVSDDCPGLVPVIKGNGYGFTNASLARRAEWLGVDTVAVGTYDEVAQVAARFPGMVLVMTPWRRLGSGPTSAAAEFGGRMIHTVTAKADLDALREVEPAATVVAELITSMKRHGMTAGELSQFQRVGNLAGVTLHLPLSGDHAREVDEAIATMKAAKLDTRTVWVSHVPPSDLAELRRRHPDFTFRPRIGTGLWLCDRSLLSATATVLDSHQVERGERYGYRQRSAPKVNQLLIVSGGTAHGVGLEAPTGELSARARAVSLAKGAMDAAGVARSPYSWRGKRLYFAEPPHMQASMLWLGDVGSGVAPKVGDELDIQVRFTATHFDRVELS